MKRSEMHPVGTLVRVRANSGGGSTLGNITAVFPVEDADDEGVKDGQPGYDYEDELGNSRWCYADQAVKA